MGRERGWPSTSRRQFERRADRAVPCSSAVPPRPPTGSSLRMRFKFDRLSIQMATGVLDGKLMRAIELLGSNVMPEVKTALRVQPATA